MRLVEFVDNNIKSTVLEKLSEEEKKKILTLTYERFIFHTEQYLKEALTKDYEIKKYKEKIEKDIDDPYITQ